MRENSEWNDGFKYNLYAFYLHSIIKKYWILILIWILYSQLNIWLVMPTK